MTEAPPEIRWCFSRYGEKYFLPGTGYLPWKKYELIGWNMDLIFIALGILFVSGLLALFLGRNNAAASFCASAGAITGSIVGIIPSIAVLVSGTAVKTVIPWQMPFGSFSCMLDPLAAFFSLIIFLISGLSALYGFTYFKAYFGTRKIAIPWFMFNVLTGSMVLVCIAQNVLFFLLSWELMTISSFFLVAFESQKVAVRKAAWTYLIATHIGTSALFLMFMIYSKFAGSMEFADFHNVLPAAQINICLILAIAGFGTKAGIMPFHVWLPEAHPVAPSHVSALMSGVMIKTGIYALLRIISFNAIPFWLGNTLLAIGIVSGILGVLFAIAQHDLKRLLAYHSVENIGIIFIGLGVGFIGLYSGNSVVAVLGFGGGILHILNHAIFKSLLFLGAGSVLHSTHTLEIDHLGGLLKRMPKTGATFLIGSAAIAGLPPFNGFVSEFLIYLAMLFGVVHFPSNSALIMLTAIISLALIGGLATACFTKAFGTIFLGEPRTENARQAKEADAFMTIPMIILSGFCILIGIAGPLVITSLSGIIRQFIPTQGADISIAAHYLTYISISGLVLSGLIGLFMTLRYFLLRNKSVRESVTWDCGYNYPSETMQYTASSFAQPITDFFNFILRTKKHFKHSTLYFPERSTFETKTPDVIRQKVYQPLFLSIKKYFSFLHIIQRGKIQIYISYLVVTLLVLLIWGMR